MLYESLLFHSFSLFSLTRIYLSSIIRPLFSVSASIHLGALSSLDLCACSREFRWYFPGSLSLTLALPCFFLIPSSLTLDISFSIILSHFFHLYLSPPFSLSLFSLSLFSFSSSQNSTLIFSFIPLDPLFSCIHAHKAISSRKKSSLCNAYLWAPIIWYVRTYHEITHTISF